MLHVDIWSANTQLYQIKAALPHTQRMVCTPSKTVIAGHQCVPYLVGKRGRPEDVVQGQVQGQVHALSDQRNHLPYKMHELYSFEDRAIPEGVVQGLPAPVVPMPLVTSVYHT